MRAKVSHNRYRLHPLALALLLMRFTAFAEPIPLPDVEVLADGGSGVVLLPAGSSVIALADFVVPGGSAGVYLVDAAILDSQRGGDARPARARREGLKCRRGRGFRR